MQQDNYITRLQIETSDLSEKITKLKNFIFSDKFDKISATEQRLLLIQYHAMETYYECLVGRGAYIKNMDNGI